MSQVDLLRPGESAWVVLPEARTRVLIDTRDYFAALVPALEQAENTVYIAGWILHGRTWLRPDAPADERAPLERYLRDLVSRRKRLRVFVLIWDPTASAGIGHAFRPIFLPDWRGTPRFRFRYDDRVPLGGSHHQKFVVIDDALGFCGGVDLAEGRWDGPEHLPEDPRRNDAEGRPHGPFHDAQVMVEGDAARALGRLFRDRWRRCTRRRLREPPHVVRDWGVGPGHELPAARLGLVRTDAVSNPPIHENQTLWRDAIASARRLLYIENQYLTSSEMGAALARRLREPDGPEVIILGPRQPAGWLEEVTVGLLRWRVIDTLRAADKHGRLRLLYPMSSVAKDIPVYLHSKILIVDDRFVRVGSANLARRSMSLDSELDAAMEVPDEPAAKCRVTALLHALLAEHLGTTTLAVAAEIQRAGSIGGAIDALRTGDHTLVTIEDGAPSEDRMFAQAMDVVVDPDEPVGLGVLTDAMIGAQARRTLRDRLPHGFFGMLLACLAVVAYRVLLHDPGDSLDTLQNWATRQGATPGGFILLGAAAATAISVGVPVAGVVLASTLILGAVGGGLLAFGAVALGALVTYGIGALVGRRWARKLFGLEAGVLSKHMMTRGLFSFVILRLLPITVFPAVGVIAGASRARLVPYLVGSMIGSLPYVAALTVLGMFLRFWLRDLLSVVDLTMFGGGALLLWLLVDRITRALRRREVRDASRRAGRLA